MADITTAELINIEKAENIIEYNFHNRSLIKKALKAPVKIEDKDTGEILYHEENNRELAQLGHRVLELHLNDKWFRAGSARGETLM